ncbi:MAG: twin-arginine translocase TatA/TatE family subunit [Gammaproteobacteria bacterium]|nr:twin-arginine translocase TatA/TatE family subunit [Gammaproteobacteria bacterium]
MNISLSEILVILLVALLVIKPEQLPEVGRFVFQAVRKIRRLFSGFKKELNDIVHDTEPKQKHDPS